ENFAGELADVIERPCQLDAAALAATACVNLRFDDPNGTAERLRRIDRFVDGKGRHAARNRHPVTAKNFFTLIFVDLHKDPSFIESRRSQPPDTVELCEPGTNPAIASPGAAIPLRIERADGVRRRFQRVAAIELKRFLRSLILPAQPPKGLHGRRWQIAEQLGQMRAALNASHRVVQPFAKPAYQIRADEV